MTWGAKSRSKSCTFLNAPVCSLTDLWTVKQKTAEKTAVLLTNYSYMCFKSRWTCDFIHLNAFRRNFSTLTASFVNPHSEQAVKVIWHEVASPPYTDGSIVFVRLRQCASPLTHASLGTPESTSQTPSRSVQPLIAGLTIVTDRPTDRQTDHATLSVTIGRNVVR